MGSRLCIEGDVSGGLTRSRVSRAAVAITIIGVYWLLRQLGLPKIRARLHDGWWVLEVFMAMTVYAALIYSGFAFIATR